MNKLAQYLNQHLIGEIIVDKSVLDQLSVDNSPLTITPEMVVYPRNTNDIRKLLRFSWQLAEKGHILSITPRGSGGDTTGGAIGKGVIVATTGHMDHVFEFDMKQRLVRLQPGTTVATVQDALNLHGMTIPELDTENRKATVGGLISSGRSSGGGSEWIDQFEVVLANGDLLQTKRLSKRELSRKKGEQTFEADIYRGVDSLIDEHADIINSLDDRSLAGYSALCDVKRKDGSLDLTPLFAASQGTLGVISEMIIKADAAPEGNGVTVAVFDDASRARDAIDGIEKIGVASLEYFDERVINNAIQSGKKFHFIEDDGTAPKAILVASYTGNTRGLAKKAKKLTKHFTQFDATIKSTDELGESDLATMTSLATLASHVEARNEAAIPVIDGLYVRLDRFEKFSEGIEALGKKLHLELPMYGRPLEGIWHVRPILNMKTVTGKQAIFKLTEELALLTTKCGGHLSGEHAEGRLQSYSAQKTFEPEVATLYQKLKGIFDPHGILNTGVKQPVELRELTSLLRDEYHHNSSDGLTHF